ncbi:MAG: Rieske 2Fe-2S domain-containing protein [Pseudomonadales bacterium]|nr:Rieske 2Fe-2S domain-containing protein [Pseudomonadales bacterium]
MSPFTGTTLPHVATYTRELPVSMARMYENAIDGDHLPWLHRETFTDMTISESDNTGWRGQGYLQPRSFTTWMELELRLDRENHRWITTTTRGLGKGSQVITHAIPLAENRIKVVVDFYVPKLPKALHKMYGKQLVDTYTRLYDQDLEMMRTRQRALDIAASAQPDSNPARIVLGNRTGLDSQLPLQFELAGRPYRLVRIGDKLVAHASTCPHRLGSLQDAKVVDGQVECPWHGYRFNVISGECTSGQHGQLPLAPVISIDNDEVVASSEENV